MVLLPGQVTRAEIVEILTLCLTDICTAVKARRPNVYWATMHGLTDYDRRKKDRERERRSRS